MRTLLLANIGGLLANIVGVFTFCLALLPGTVVAQSFQQLDAPRANKTGAYHGKILVSDGLFVDDDRLLVVAINESISVFDTRTGDRIRTIVNNTTGGKGGYAVGMLHLVNDGKTVLCDSFGTWIGSDGAQYDPAAWLTWSVSELASQADPVGTPFFSRIGLDRSRTNPLEKDLQFIRQFGDDYLFLSGHYSSKPTTIRVFRPGDPINQPRQEIPIDLVDDDPTEHLFDRGGLAPLFVCSSKGPPSRLRDNAVPVSERFLWEMHRDAAQKISVTSKPMEIAPLVGQNTKQTVLPSATGYAITHDAHDLLFGVWRQRNSSVGAQPFLQEGSVVPIRGLPSPDGRWIAISDHAPASLGRLAQQRNGRPVGVRIIDRQSEREIHALPSGRGFLAYPIAISSDSTMIATVQPLARPNIRLWKLPLTGESKSRYPNARKRTSPR